jgi:Amt family ammonium transporter
MMTLPGLALFYGGLVRAKNVLSILMQCLVTLAVVSVTWVLWGYSLAFGPDHGGLVGDLSHFALQGVGYEAEPGENIPRQAFMVFQLMFAVITPALITGAFAERMKFSAFFLFITLWSTLVYSPLAHWVWAQGGWLLERGALDFAGGTVVHISSGTAALVAAAMVGRRRGFGTRAMAPHNVPLTVAGAALLWVGWFGFNAGSALAANGTAVRAFVNTNTATGAAVLAWMFAEWIGRGKPTVLGAATGAVAGLVAITPAAGYVLAWSSLLIGAAAGIVCYKVVAWKHRIGYDDALDVVGVHGAGGTVGALLTGYFATETGLLYTGEWEQIGEQCIAVLATYGFVGVGTFLVLGLVSAAVGLRVDEEAEEIGLDLALHSESAYGTTPGAATPLGVPRERAVSTGVERAPAAPRSAPSGLESVPVARPARSGARNPPAPALAHAPPPALAPSAPSESGPYRVSIEGIEPSVLERWWRNLCHDPAGAPQAFQEVYPHVSLFDRGVCSLRGGEPHRVRERLEFLLDVYGLKGGTVRVERGG